MKGTNVFEFGAETNMLPTALMMKFASRYDYYYDFSFFPPETVSWNLERMKFVASGLTGCYSQQ